MLRSTMLVITVAGAAFPAHAAETRATAAAQLKTEFAASDTDRDGYLSRAEVAARVGRMRIAGKPASKQQVSALTDLWFGRADTDGDGRVSRAEMGALLGKTFARFDADHDGKISAGERAAAKRAAIRGR